MKTNSIIWLSERSLTEEERRLIVEIHGDEATISRADPDLGERTDAFARYLERQNEGTMVYTDAPTYGQLFHALQAGTLFGFFEYEEKVLRRVLRANPETRDFGTVRKLGQPPDPVPA